MSTPTHYTGFDDPCVPVQYDGTNHAAVFDAFDTEVHGSLLHDESAMRMIVLDMFDVVPGQWIAKHFDGTVTVQDEEPPRVLGEFKRERHAYNPDSERVEFNGFDLLHELSNGALVPWDYVSYQERLHLRAQEARS